MTEADQSPFSAEHMIRHFWRRRLFLIILVPAFFVISAFIVRTYIPEEFVASGQFRFRKPPSANYRDLGDASERMTAPAYEEVFMNDQLLREVVEKARAEVPNFPKRSFESIRNGFDAEVVLTRETAVVSEYSPVIKLSVQSTSPDSAYQMADIWMDLIINRYGGVRAREATTMRDTFQTRFNEYSDKIDNVLDGLNKAQQELDRIATQRQAKYLLLTGMSVVGGNQPQTTNRQQPEPRQAEKTVVSSGGTGLLEQQIEAQVQLSEYEGQEDQQAKAEAARLSSRLEKIQSLITDTEADIAALDERELTLKKVVSRAMAELETLEHLRENASEVIVNVTPDTTLTADPLNPSVMGDFSVLGRPVKPEVRVAPNRMLYTIVGGVLLSGMLILLILIEFYTRAGLMATERIARK